MSEGGVKENKENLYNKEVLKAKVLLWDAMAFLYLLLMR